MASKIEPKIAGYAGYQSYGVLPYPSLKPGDMQDPSVYKQTRRKEDELKYYRNYDRNGKSIYTTDISENTSPQHYLDLKIIKKGQGQNDLKGFLSSYMEGSKFYTTQKIGEGDDSELKMGIDIHRKFLEDNDQFVQAKDFSKIEEMAKNNQNIQLISKTNQSRLAHDLELPDELVPVWRVENSMYDVYYIPGYDNWMVNKVKADPNSVGTLSKYKQKFFETLNGQRNLHQGPVDILESELIASEAANMNRTNGIDKQISLSQIQNPTGVGLNHSQFNETGVHQSKVSRVEKTGNLQGPEDNLLKSGTEFWQTSYQASIVDPYKNCTRTTLNPFDFKADGPRKTDKIEDKIRKNRKTQCRTQVTEFNFSYGVHGSNPRSIMPPNSTFKPFINDPLKHGTTQITHHIPNYTGFIPSSNMHFTKAVEQSKGINTRTTWIKENITDNFDNYVPGYAGFKPSTVTNRRDKPRESVFYS